MKRSKPIVQHDLFSSVPADAGPLRQLRPPRRPRQLRAALSAPHLPVDADTAESLRRLLDTRPVGALGTLHRGEPAVSMVPFVLPAADTRLFIHVSTLASHTRDMQDHPRVSLLVMADPRRRADVRAG
jgi:Pyridoxamine 5'-phosphate oxidase